MIVDSVTDLPSSLLCLHSKHGVLFTNELSAATIRGELSAREKESESVCSGSRAKTLKVKVRLTN